jgi:hypothetical protein
MHKLLLLFVLLMTGIRSQAAVTYTGTYGSQSASVTFQTLANGLLQVTLSNNAVMGATSYSDVLTAVYFTTSGDNPMFAQSAEVADLSSIRNCSTSACNTSNVSGEWAYRDQASFVTNAGNAHLLSANSLGGVLTSSERIGTTNVAGTSAIGGSDFGLVSAATRFTSSNPLSSVPLIRDSVVFTLNPSSDFAYSAIGTVGFIYGSNVWSMEAYGETPEPGTMLLMGSTLIALGLWRRKSPTAASDSKDQLQS